jgi:hypothetical protein
VVLSEDGAGMGNGGIENARMTRLVGWGYPTMKAGHTKGQRARHA